MALRDLLDLPDSVRANDFVIRLTHEVKRQEHVLDDYAVTPGILRAYDQALQLVGSALSSQQSMAAYIHGSFGAGKSHFMAVLSLLLGNARGAWEHEAFRELRARHAIVERKKILRLHFHMIGARSLEERVLGGYAEQIKTLHPEAPLPALWQDAGLFADADRLRQDMGDEAFFRKLNAGLEQAAPEGWGAFAAQARWTPETFHAAAQSQSRDERAALFDALVRCYFSAYTAGTEQYIDIDRGLSVMSSHARALGYDAIVLFLDELVLWLSARANDTGWLNTEVQKMVKLVESQSQSRPIPLISFVARQRDMRQMVGEHFAGVAAQNLADSLRWWEGRLSTITLEDRNLPAIIEKRVVRPRDAQAREQLDGAFAKVRRTLNAQGWEMLRGEEGDEQSFRQVYPFSPALVSTLVALSSSLQRERTALKLLVELLVDHMKDFQLGQLMPVGDLFDVLSESERPMDGVMRDRFEAARRLYRQELLPLIQRKNQTDNEKSCQRLQPNHPESLGCANCEQKRCRADNRLVKTILLSALVPETPALKGLTVSRLVRLNHGTLPQGPIPGRETQDALARIRDWAGEVGKLRLGDGNDPSVGAMLEGVDLKPILQSAQGADSEGARRRRVHRLLFQAFGLAQGAVTVEHEVVFHGIKRKGVVHFGNVREMTDEQLQARPGEDFKVILDYPFDIEGHSPSEDVEHLQRFLAQGKSTPTVVWLPSFFGERVIRDLADLVVLDKLQEKTDEARGYLAHLRTEDASRARLEIDNLASQKEARVKSAIDAVYGVTEDRTAQDPARSLSEHFHALMPGITMRAPESLAANLASALERTIETLLEQRYPRHPRFVNTVTTAKLKSALRRFTEVCQSPGQRTTPQTSDKNELDVPRGLGLMLVTEGTAMVLPDRLQDIQATLHRNGIVQPTVAQVRQAADPQKVQGLTQDVSDFLVLAWAQATNREVRKGGQVLGESAIGHLPDDAELWLPPLPSETQWQAALKTLQGLVGEATAGGRASGATLEGKALHPQNLRTVVEQIGSLRARLTATRAHEVVDLLKRRADYLSEGAPRLTTALAAQRLWNALDTTDPVALIDALATFMAETSIVALRKHIDTSPAVASTLREDLHFQILAGLLSRQDVASQDLLGKVRALLSADEVQATLSAELPPLVAKAQQLLMEANRKPPIEKTGIGDGDGDGTIHVIGVKPPQPPGPPPVSGRGGSLSELEAALERIRLELGPGDTLSFTWTITRGR